MSADARAFRRARHSAAGRGAVTLGDVEAAFGRSCGLGERASTEVPLRQIVGTIARGADFDRDLRPLGDHLADRWRSIHRLVRDGHVTGCVSLVRAGDVYLVDDGHHRASVARSRGQVVIDACVRELCTPRSACLACLTGAITA